MKEELASLAIAQETSLRHIEPLWPEKGNSKTKFFLRTAVGISVEVDGKGYMREVGVEAQLLDSLSVYSLRRYIVGQHQRGKGLDV